MISAGRLAVSLALAGATLGMPVQNPFIVLPPSAAANKAAVQKIFTDSFAAYTYVGFPFLVVCRIDTDSVCQTQKIRLRPRRLVPSQPEYVPRRQFSCHTLMLGLPTGFSDGRNGWGTLRRNTSFLLWLNVCL